MRRLSAVRDEISQTVASESMSLGFQQSQIPGLCYDSHKVYVSGLRSECGGRMYSRGSENNNIFCQDSICDALPYFPHRHGVKEVGSYDALSIFALRTHGRPSRIELGDATAMFTSSPSSGIVSTPREDGRALRHEREILSCAHTDSPRR